MDKDDDEAESQWIKINNMQGKYDIWMNMIYMNESYIYDNIWDLLTGYKNDDDEDRQNLKA